MRVSCSGLSVRLTLAAVLVAAFAGTVRAQQVDVRAISFGIDGGSSSPLGATRDSYKPGFNGGAFARLDFGKVPVALRGDFTYSNFELQRAVIPAAGSPGGGTGTLLGGVGDLQLYLRSGSVRPYVLAGAGAWSVRTEFDSDQVPSHTEMRFGTRATASRTSRSRPAPTGRGPAWVFARGATA